MGEGLKRARAAAKATRVAGTPCAALARAVRDYLSEIENPVPDMRQRGFLRDAMRAALVKMTETGK